VYRDQLTSQQASLLSHALVEFALQRRPLSLSDSMFDMDPAEVAKATTEAASWAHAGPHCEHQGYQTLLSQYLLLRRDAVIPDTASSQQTFAPSGFSTGVARLLRTQVRRKRSLADGGAGVISATPTSRSQPSHVGSKQPPKRK